MRVLHRSLAVVAVTVVCCNLISPRVRADGLYSVTDLGAASPTGGSYLNLLSAAQLAAFQAGSFDVYAHPATAYYTSVTNPDSNTLQGADASHSVTLSIVTGNNVGQYTGTAQVGGPSITDLVYYQPYPHTITDFSPHGAGLQSSGYIYEVITPNGQFFNFDGAAAGINDHSVIAYNIYTPRQSARQMELRLPTYRRRDSAKALARLVERTLSPTPSTTSTRSSAGLRSPAVPSTRFSTLAVQCRT